MDARVRPMHRPERVTHIDVREFRQSLCKLLVVLLFTLVKAKILEQTKLTCAQVEDDLLDRVANTIVGQMHFHSAATRAFSSLRAGGKKLCKAKADRL
jgi:hypothetical protein